MTLAQAQAESYPQNEALYLEVINSSEPRTDNYLQQQETAFAELAKVYADHAEADKLRALVTTARAATASGAKSKSSKVIRSLLDQFEKIPNSRDLLIKTVEECIEWSKQESRTFLRQHLELRLIALWHKAGEYKKAIEIIGRLLLELKKLDDKLMLAEVQLLEARVYHSLRNLAKARASLTSARTSANSVYCPTRLQAELDTMSGVLLAEDGDYKTSFSYFYEALDGYSSLDDEYTVTVVKYLLLVKIMLNLTEDVDQLMANKTVQKHTSPDISAMLAVSKAHSERDLKQFERVVAQNREFLESDQFIRAHLSTLYDKLLQDNLVKVVEPYSCVEISYLAKQLGLDVEQVEGKLGQMILDKVFNGVLDQGNGWLFIYPEVEGDSVYESSLETIKHMSTAVDMLYEKASAIRQ